MNGRTSKIVNRHARKNSLGKREEKKYYNSLSHTEKIKYRKKNKIKKEKK